jgi:CRISPR/Cas system CSM-associated protein Csm4 (group 5 of RAMP superfamily)
VEAFGGGEQEELLENFQQTTFHLNECFFLVKDHLLLNKKPTMRLDSFSVLRLRTQKAAARRWENFEKKAHESNKQTNDGKHKKLSFCSFYLVIG